MLNMTISFDSLNKLLAREYKKAYTKIYKKAADATLDQVNAIEAQERRHKHVYLALAYNGSDTEVIGVYETRDGAYQCTLNTCDKTHRDMSKYGVIKKKLRPA